jgi:Xaa-Pro aminopeptidase
VNHSVVVGPPAPADWATAGQYSIDTMLAVVDAIAPGKTVHEVASVYDRRREAFGQRASGMIFHSGEVRTGSGEGRFASDVVLEPGMVFDIKPTIELKDGQPAQFGTSIVVTEDGARRLDKRELKLITLNT